MADVEFFWDPICPWAWITSRWVVEVAGPRSLDVRWRAISLRMVNEDRYDTDQELARKKEAHAFGLGLLRVAATVDADHGNEAVGRLYTGLGTVLHIGDDGEAVMAAGPRALAERVLADCSLPLDLAGATEDEAWDALVREDTVTSLERSTTAEVDGVMAALLACGAWR